MMLARLLYFAGAVIFILGLMGRDTLTVIDGVGVIVIAIATKVMD